MSEEHAVDTSFLYRDEMKFELKLYRGIWELNLQIELKLVCAKYLKTENVNKTLESVYQKTDNSY